MGCPTILLKGIDMARLGAIGTILGSPILITAGEFSPLGLVVLNHRDQLFLAYLLLFLLVLLTVFS